MKQKKVRRQIEILSAQAGEYMLNSIKADLKAKQEKKEWFWFGALLARGIVRPVRNDGEIETLFV